jgi:ribosomal protein L37AE/L43A
MQHTGGSTVSPQGETQDITFACEHCESRFIVDAAAAGLTLTCQKCGKPTTVPSTVPNPALEVAAEDAIRISELQRHLKENESQRTEITSYINQLSIQLHRWQLRLQTLKERQLKLETELAEVCGRSARPVESAPVIEEAEPTLSEAQSSG